MEKNKNSIYPNLLSILKSESMMTINANDENDISDSVSTISTELTSFALSKDTKLLYENFLEVDSYFKRRFQVLSLLKEIVKSNETFNKHKQQLKVLHNKRTIMLKDLINKLINELSLFSNKLLFIEYEYKLQDI
jgi:hypothetical protein